MSEPLSRRVHREYNNLVVNLEGNSLYEYIRDFFEASRGFELQEGEYVQYEGEERETQEKVASRFAKKYRVEGIERPITGGESK